MFESPASLPMRVASFSFPAMCAITSFLMSTHRNNKIPASRVASQNVFEQKAVGVAGVPFTSLE